MTGGVSGEHDASEPRYAATLAGVREAAERIACHAHVTPVRGMPTDPHLTSVFRHFGRGATQLPAHMGSLRLVRMLQALLSGLC